jgi:hypothetical protein
MFSTAFLAIATMAVGANAHFRLLEPKWRGSSFEEPASQWIYPCANVNETTDMANRTSPLLTLPYQAPLIPSTSSPPDPSPPALHSFIDLR